MSVLVVGGTGIDTVVPVAALPVPLADSVPAGPIRDHVAHTGTGVALGLHALGVPVSIVDSIGADDTGTRIRTAFEAWGIPLYWAPSPAGTRRAVNLMDPTGRRLSLYDARDTPGYRLPASAYAALLPGIRHAHVSIMDWARYLLPELRAAGATVSTDLHDWDGHREYHWDFAAAADIVFVSTVSLAVPLAETASAIFDRGVASLVIGTAGAAGAYLVARSAPAEVRHEPAADPGAPIVDTNGAGDAFAAAFLAGWLAGYPAADCLHRAAVAGAYACTRPVGADAFIDARQLDERIDSSNHGRLTT